MHFLFHPLYFADAYTAWKRDCLSQQNMLWIRIGCFATSGFSASRIIVFQFSRSLLIFNCFLIPVGKWIQHFEFPAGIVFEIFIYNKMFLIYIYGLISLYAYYVVMPCIELHVYIRRYAWKKRVKLIKTWRPTMPTCSSFSRVEGERIKKLQSKIHAVFQRSSCAWQHSFYEIVISRKICYKW